MLDLTRTILFHVKQVPAHRNKHIIRWHCMQGRAPVVTLLHPLCQRTVPTYLHRSANQETLSKTSPRLHEAQLSALAVEFDASARESVCALAVTP